MLYIEPVEGLTQLAGRYVKAKAKEHSAHPCYTLSKRLILHQDSLFQFVLQTGPLG